MRQNHQLLVIAVLTILISAIGVHEARRPVCEPQIMRTARAALVRLRADRDAAVGESGTGCRSVLFGSAEPELLEAIGRLIAMVGGDTVILFSSDEQLAQRLAGEQYGEWGNEYVEMARDPMVQNLVRDMLSQHD